MELCSGGPCPEGTVLHCGESLGVGALPRFFVRARLQPCRSEQRRRAALAAEVMAIPRRRVRAPGTYFVTSRTWESRALFTQEAKCRLFVEILFHYRDEGAYQRHAFVLMPDHFHLLLTPGVSASLERAVQLIKGGSARKIGKELKVRFPVWQRGFSDHRIRDAKDYQVHVHYIEQNPVKRRLVIAASEYAWTSACGKFSLDEQPQGLKPHERETVFRHD